MADVKISTLGGKPLLYDRSAPGHYGVGGVPTQPFMNPVFARECDAMFTELVDRLKADAGLEVSKILTGGVSRSGTGASLHHQNRAFDLDALLFKDGSNWVSTTFPQRPQLYLGIEAVLRRHFGTVLSYDYNRAHQDHFHFDNGTPVKFKSAAKSHVIFIQNVIALVYQTRVGRDGVWGPETERELKTLRQRLGIGALSEVANWKAFLTRVAQDAMAQEKGTVAEPVPAAPAAPRLCHSCGQPLPA